MPQVSIDVMRLTRCFVSHECEMMSSATGIDMSLLRRSIGELKRLNMTQKNIKSSKQRTNTINDNMAISDSVPCCNLRLCLKGLIQDPVLVFVKSQKANTTPVRMPRAHLYGLFQNPYLDFSASGMQSPGVLLRVKTQCTGSLYHNQSMFGSSEE